ncbi:MAG TPA: GIY-YIG nuclease family protein [Candidatus Babeliaceae bacterium]|nr:GIY-YIG nuclease family protein [Candidatus Babeliaceae bacterium]
MPFYVYILQSLADNSFYKGFSEQPFVRLDHHNNGEATYTSNKRPWKIIYIEELETKKEALIREKSLKKYSKAQIEQLIISSKNIISQFGSSIG